MYFLTTGKNSDILMGMGGRRYFKIYRRAAAKRLGRPLRADEVVHHIDGNCTNNSLENLEVMTVSEHSSLHGKASARKQKLEARRLLEKIEREAADPIDIFWSRLAKIDLSEIVR